MSTEDSRLGNDECGGNAAPYVLGALTPAEHEAFSEHLSSCAICREEVASLQMVAASLPSAAPPLAAPRGLKRRVMAEVREDARATRAAQPAASRARGGLGGRRWRPVLAPVALGLAAVVALALLLTGGTGSGKTQVFRAQLTAPGATGSVITSDGHAQISLSGMPQTRPGRVYELWIERAGPPSPTDALFTVTAHGDATVAVPGTIAGVRELLVTSEPRGGSQVPTTAPVMVAKLS